MVSADDAFGVEVEVSADDATGVSPREAAGIFVGFRLRAWRKAAQAAAVKVDPVV